MEIRHLEWKKSGNQNSGSGNQQAALLFWLFGELRCGVLLLIVILMIHKYNNK